MTLRIFIRGRRPTAEELEVAYRDAFSAHAREVADKMAMMRIRSPMMAGIEWSWYTPEMERTKYGGPLWWARPKSQERLTKPVRKGRRDQTLGKAGEQPFVDPDNFLNPSRVTL